jgi:hypothetical protein
MSCSVAVSSSATQQDVSDGTSTRRPERSTPLRRPFWSKRPNGLPPNERPSLSSEWCARQGTRAPPWVRVQSSWERSPLERGSSRSSRHTRSRMLRRDGSTRVRCCGAPRRADWTPSPSRSGRSGNRARRRSASAETSCGIGSTSCAKRSGRPGRRTRSWRRSRRGSRSRESRDVCERLASSTGRWIRSKSSQLGASGAGLRSEWEESNVASLTQRSVISGGGGSRARVLRQLLMIERRNAVGRSECVRGRLPLPQALRDELGPLLHARAVQHLDV